VTDSLF